MILFYLTLWLAHKITKDCWYQKEANFVLGLNIIIGILLLPLTFKAGLLNVFSGIALSFLYGVGFIVLNVFFIFFERSDPAENKAWRDALYKGGYEDDDEDDDYEESHSKYEDDDDEEYKVQFWGHGGINGWCDTGFGRSSETAAYNMFEDYLRKNPSGRARLVLKRNGKVVAVLGSN